MQIIPIVFATCAFCFASAFAAGAVSNAPVFLSRPTNAGVLRPGVSKTLIAQNNAAPQSIALQVQQLQGSEALDVQGEAPANSPVTITLFAVVSSDVPTIVVSRHDVVTDVNGRFGAVIPIASAFERGTILRVVATSSLPGIASASAQLTANAPNSGVTVPLEQPPH